MKRFLFVIIFLFSSQSVFSNYDRKYQFCINNNETPLVGQKNDKVREMQLFLKNKYGFLTAVTGRYDNQTKTSVRKFQHAFGLGETGIVNLATFAKMKEMAECANFDQQLKKQVKRIIEKGEDIRLTQNISQTNTHSGNGVVVVSTYASESTTPSLMYATQTAILNPLAVQNQLINKLLEEQFTQKGLSVNDSLRNTGSNDNLNGLKIFIDDKVNVKYNYIVNLLSSDSNITTYVNTLNEIFILPKNINVVFMECKEVNAFFESSTDSIHLCLELIDQKVSEDNREGVATSTKIRHAYEFTFLHELGHALTYYYDLPITGKEESAVDEFAMYILYKINTPESLDSAFQGLQQHYNDAVVEGQNLKDNDFWRYADDHDLSLVRYYDLLKFMLGIAPSYKSYYIGNEAWQIPKDRTTFIDVDANRKIKTWDKLLEGKRRR